MTTKAVTTVAHDSAGAPGCDSAWPGIWSRFEEGPATLPETPGAREAWHRGRNLFAVWVLRVTVPEICERATTVAAALGDAIEPQPLSELHVTVFVAGFPTTGPLTFDDDVHEETLAAQEGAVEGQIGEIPLRVRGASSFLSAPFLEVADPTGRLARLRSTLGACGREVRFAPYHPHLTVGRYHDARGTAPLAARLRPWRELSPLVEVSQHLDLVTFRTQIAGSPLVTARRICLSI